MSKKQGKVDLAKFREVHQEQREQAKKGPEGHTLVARAVVRLVEDQLKEARVGEYTIQCDEAKSRKGGGKAPSPVQYFVADALSHIQFFKKRKPQQSYDNPRLVALK